MKEEIIKVESILLRLLEDKVVHWTFQTEYDYAVRDITALIKALKNKGVAQMKHDKEIKNISMEVSDERRKNN